MSRRKRAREVWVVRHGVTEAARPDLLSGKRDLSKKGVRKLCAAVEMLNAEGVRFDLILHGPTLRCIRTAELLLPLLRGGGRTRVMPRLNATPVKKVVEQLRGKRVAVVGHGPEVDKLVSVLVHGDPAEAVFRRPMRRGRIAHLVGKAKPGRMELLALIPGDPDML